MGKKTQLFVWQYIKEAWNFWNKTVHGENGFTEGKWKFRMYGKSNKIKGSDPQVGYRAKHLLSADLKKEVLQEIKDSGEEILSRNSKGVIQTKEILEDKQYTNNNEWLQDYESRGDKVNQRKRTRINIFLRCLCVEWMRAEKPKNPI